VSRVSLWVGVLNWDRSSGVMSRSSRYLRRSDENECLLAVENSLEFLMIWEMLS